MLLELDVIEAPAIETEEFQPVPKIPLSAAMRAGAALSDQCFRQLIDVYGRTCALGAAALGAGIVVETIALFDTWPELDGPASLAPNPEALPTDTPFDLGCVYLSNLIEFLNDTRGWSRERIADLVEALGY